MLHIKPVMKTCPLCQNMTDEVYRCKHCGAPYCFHCGSPLGGNCDKCVGKEIKRLLKGRIQFDCEKTEARKH